MALFKSDKGNYVQPTLRDSSSLIVAPVYVRASGLTLHNPKIRKGASFLIRLVYIEVS